MRLDPKDLRLHYESLSDEGLLDVDPAGLVPAARKIYDDEIARRGLARPAAGPSESEPEEEPYHSPLPVFKRENRNLPGSLADTADGPPPAWLEDAACPWSAYVDTNVDYMTTG